MVIEIPRIEGWKKDPDNDIWKFNNVVDGKRIRLRARLKRKGSKWNADYQGVVKNLATGKLVARTSVFTNRKAAKGQLDNVRERLSNDIL